MYRLLLILFLIIFSQPRMAAQDIWPGDVNNNGLVNGADLLYWGLAYNTTGPARAVVSTDWSAQPAGPSWAQSFPSGINYAFADCNGDGRIDDDDFDDAIEDNFGLTHGTPLADGYTGAGTNQGLRLRMQPSATLVEEGAIIDVDLIIDDANANLENFYGIAMKMSYSTGLLMDDSGPDFDFTEDGWMEAGDDNATGFFFDGDGSGLAELAFTRTNQAPVAVESQSIGQFQIIVEDIIVGLEIDTFILTIDSVLLVGLDFVPLAVAPDTVRIIIAKDTSKLTSASETLARQQVQNSIRIFPNPSSSFFRISSPVPIQEAFLLDAYGKQRKLVIPAAPGISPPIRLPNGLPPGLYALHLRTARGDFLKKLLLTP